MGYAEKQLYNDDTQIAVVRMRDSNTIERGGSKELDNEMDNGCWRIRMMISSSLRIVADLRHLSLDCLPTRLSARHVSVISYHQ